MTKIFEVFNGKYNVETGNEPGEGNKWMILYFAYDKTNAEAYPELLTKEELKPYHGIGLRGYNSPRERCNIMLEYLNYEPNESPCIYRD